MLLRRRSLHARMFVICAVMFVFQPRAWSSDAAVSASELNEARERFAEGRKLEDAGRFDEALVAFKQVARVKTTPQVRFHIALCLMRTNNPVDAIQEFHTAILEAGTTAPNVVAEAKQHIATLEKVVGVVTIRIAAPELSDSVVTFDGRVETPGKLIYAAPGRHLVELIHHGQTLEKRPVMVSAGEHAWVDLAPSETSTNGRRVASFVTLGVAGVSVLGVATFAILRADRLAKLEAECPSLKNCDRSLESVVHDGKTYSAAINVFGGVAAAAAVTGIVLYVSSQTSTPERSTAKYDLHIVPVVGREAGFVTLNGRF